MTALEPTLAGLAADDALSESISRLEEALWSVGQAMTRSRSHDRLLAEAGVDVGRAGAFLLFVLSKAGPMRIGELACRLGVDAPSVTRQAQLLEAAGLIARQVDPGDRRAAQLYTTEAGLATVRRLARAKQKLLAELISDWTDDDLRQLADLLDRLAQAVTSAETNQASSGGRHASSGITEGTTHAN
jgi:DNA-binding MarR family transcriptional regulator